MVPRAVRALFTSFSRLMLNLKPRDGLDSNGNK